MDQKFLHKKQQPQHTRAERRELDEINKEFDRLMQSYLHTRVLHGDKKEFVEIHREQLEVSWRQFAGKWNSNRKHRIRVDSKALGRQIDARLELESITEEKQRKERNNAEFSRWSQKMMICHPGLWRWYKLMNRLKKDYVQEKFKELEGKSPRGRWIK